MHVWSLASCLQKLGHKVIIITHAYAPRLRSEEKEKNKIHQTRTGVRYLPGPIKVYYCPFVPFVSEDTLPTFIASFPLLRWILIREKIEIVHAHQATSTLSNESIVYASELGLASVYTDHSLFGFSDVGSLVLNKVLKSCLSTVSHAIGVSHICRDNLILRASLNPHQVSVIPNAVDTSKFTPDPSARSKDRITIVVVSRLVYRKGVGLLTGIIPEICRRYPHVDFLIGGDGSNKLQLEEMAEKHQLNDEHKRRVTFLGAVPHSGVRDVLIRGHLFLNCSLTESFCIALLEASSCGLFPVSTNVGGIPEVLPEDMCLLSPEPKVDSLIDTLSKAIETKVRYNKQEKQYETVHDPYEFHLRVNKMYSWMNVAKKTVKVYNHVSSNSRKLTFLERLEKYRSVGGFSGIVVCHIFMIIHFFVIIVEWFQPLENIDVVPDLS